MARRQGAVARHPRPADRHAVVRAGAAGGRDRARAARRRDRGAEDRLRAHRRRASDAPRGSRCGCGRAHRRSRRRGRAAGQVHRRSSREREHASRPSPDDRRVPVRAGDARTCGARARRRRASRLSRHATVRDVAAHGHRGRRRLIAVKNGPEPLERGFTTAFLAGRLARRTAPLKAAILDQRTVAGLGNIYADEALWHSRLHPQRPAGEISRGRDRGSARARSARRCGSASAAAARRCTTRRTPAARCRTSFASTAARESRAIAAARRSRRSSSAGGERRSARPASRRRPLLD